MDGQGDLALIIAEGLLEEGILLDCDWEREIGLIGSLMLGLRRWTLETTPGSDEDGVPFRFFPMEMGFSDRCQSFGVVPSGDIGGFALLKVAHSYGVIIGPRIEAIEEWLPGAGYSVLHALDVALSHSVDAASPRWALRQVGWWWENRDEQDCDDEINPHEFRKHFPKGALSPKWRVRVMREAQAKAMGLPRDSWMRGAIEIAWNLKSAVAAWRREVEAGKCQGDDTSGCYEFEYLPPVVLMWRNHDEVERVFDDVAEMAWQAETSNAMYMAKFPSADTNGVRKAIRGIRHCLLILTLCDELLVLLDSEHEALLSDMMEEAEESVEVRVGV